MLKAKTKQTENKYKNFFCARDLMACQWMGGQKVQKGHKGEEKRAEQQEERTTKHSKMK